MRGKPCTKTRKPSLHTLDSEFSKWIRKRDGYTCQRCGRTHPENSSGLHASHFIGRANRAVRWDPQNVDAACNGCHQWWETHKATHYRDWKMTQLGEDAFWGLIARSNQVTKWTADQLQELRRSWK